MRKRSAEGACVITAAPTEPDRLKEADTYAREHGLHGFACNQMMFVLADVVPETLVEPQLTILDDAYYQYEKQTGLSFMAYMCLAGGYFSKRMAGKPVSPSKRNGTTGKRMRPY